jgi:DNA-dependent RNA polymerase auxiliary subunit epsilon
MQELKRRDEELQDRFEPAQVNLAGAAGAKPDRMTAIAPRSANTMDEQFPTADLKADDERDKVMAAKLALQDPARPGYTQFGKLEATDADFKWLQKKQAAVEEANFQLWFAKEYDRMSPAEKKRAKELYPEFYAQRKKLLKKQAKNLVRLASIKLEGVESFDDLRLQYEAETGRLDVGPLTHLLHPEKDENYADLQQRKFTRGLLSPFRVFGDEAVARTAGATVQQTRKLQAEAFNSYDRPQDGLGLSQGFPPLPSGGATTFAQTGDKDWFATMRSLLQ